MRNLLMCVALVFPLCLNGCSKDPKERLQGKWGGQTVKQIDESQKAEATTWAQGVRFEFDKNKMTVSLPSDQPRSGDFDIEDVSGDKLTVRVARESGGSDTAALRFEGSKLVWDVGSGREVVMTRVD